MRGSTGRRRSKQVTPLRAVTRGVVAGAVGTAVMDLLWYTCYKRGGGEQSPLQWEFGEGVTGWDDVSAPGQVGRRVVEGFLARELPDSRARLTNNVVHWVYGIAWGAHYGIVAGSSARPRSAWGLVLGPAVWLSGYAVLPLAKLYKPMWEYDTETLAKDLSAHVAYGAATGAAFAALSREADRGE